LRHSRHPPLPGGLASGDRFTTQSAQGARVPPYAANRNSWFVSLSC
jgi:hypothetical protein